jgi:hypothetical protein
MMNTLCAIAIIVADQYFQKSLLKNSFISMQEIAGSNYTVIAFSTGSVDRRRNHEQTAT